MAITCSVEVIEDASGVTRVACPICEQRSVVAHAWDAVRCMCGTLLVLSEIGATLWNARRVGRR